MCLCVHVLPCVCVCVLIKAGGWWGKKGDSHYPLCLVWGQTAGFNQLRCMCLCMYACVCVWQRESPVSAGMEMSLVMHLPLSLVPDSLSHPCIAHVCRLLPILHPSLSVHPTSSLHPHPTPSLPLRQRQKPLQVTTVWLWSCCSNRIMLYCCLCCLSGLHKCCSTNCYYPEVKQHRFWIVRYLRIS